jgi:hypothetical protein
MANRPDPITECSSKYGAPMGRRSDLAGDGEPIKLHLRYVPFVDGCYDQGGAYWGSPANLYVAWGYEDQGDGEYRYEYYIRANSRNDAKDVVKEHRHNATFYR